MDSVVDDNYCFSAYINRYLVGKVKILTDKFLPSFFYPFWLKSGQWKDGRIVGKRFQTVIETVFLAFYGFIT